MVNGTSKRKQNITTKQTPQSAVDLGIIQGGQSGPPLYDPPTSGERRDVDVVALPVHGLDLGEAELLDRLTVLQEHLEEVGVRLQLLGDQEAEVHHDVVRHGLVIERRPQLGKGHGLLQD